MDIKSLRLLFLIALAAAQPSVEAQPSSLLIKSIGVDQEADSPYMFGHIVGIALDDDRNIYVLDADAYLVRVFSWEGIYIRSIGRGRGGGPGEFLLPNGISLGPDGNVYVADPEAGRIVLYSPDGEYLDQISGILASSPPTVLDDEHILMSRGALTWTQPLLLRYSRDGGIQGTAIDPAPDGKPIAFAVASSVNHAPTPDGNIVVVRPYPYEIFILDKDLTILTHWLGEEGVVDIPPYQERGGAWRLDARAFRITTDRDGKIFVGIRRRNKDIREYFIDIYSSDGSFDIRIPTTELGLSYLQFFQIGPNNVMICNQWEPFPQIWLLDLSDFLVHKQ